jgi:predicted exporter
LFVLIGVNVTLFVLIGVNVTLFVLIGVNVTLFVLIGVNVTLFVLVKYPMQRQKYTTPAHSVLLIEVIDLTYLSDTYYSDEADCIDLT